jgi:imidazolonepropionase-like amidohydrolase
MREVQRSNLARLQAAGVPLLIGSDVFIATARAELHSLEDLGLDRATVLRLATQVTPRALFPGRKLGCFESGCEASFLLLGGDPMADLAQVDMPLLRVKQGRLLTRLADVAAASSQASTSTADAPKKTAGKAKAKGGKAKTPSKAKRR